MVTKTKSIMLPISASLVVTLLSSMVFLGATFNKVDNNEKRSFKNQECKMDKETFNEYKTGSDKHLERIYATLDSIDKKIDQLRNR